MREHKYRAWDIVDHRWLSQYEVGQRLKHEVWNTKERSNWIILMQYTNLKDKNRKEIYCSDLLKDKNGNIRDVHWSDREGGWCSKCVSDTGHHPEFNNERIGYGWLIMKGCEVIGNIYENKELLNAE